MDNLTPITSSYWIYLVGLLEQISFSYLRWLAKLDSSNISLIQIAWLEAILWLGRYIPDSSKFVITTSLCLKYIHMFNLVTIWDFMSVFYPLSWILYLLDWVYLLTHSPGTINLRRYHKILKWNPLIILWIFMPWSMRNSQLLHRTSGWVPLCLLLLLWLLVLVLCRLCSFKHVLEAISGAV